MVSYLKIVTIFKMEILKTKFKDLLIYKDKTFSEHMISVNQEHLPFGYKGILDNVVMDYDTKTLFINDLKTY